MYTTSTHCLTNGTIFVKKKKFVFRFLLHCLSEMFLILIRFERGMIINVYRSYCKVPDIVVGI